MLGFGWLTLRQAQEALANGRLEDAQRLLARPGVLGHKGSWELLQGVAQGFVRRGEKNLGQHNPAAAWDDLLRAEQIVKEKGTAPLRQALVELGLAEARAFLEAGEASRAAEAVARLRDRGVQQTEVQLLEEAARLWSSARELADRGEFGQARQAVERIFRHWHGSWSALDHFQEQLRQRQQLFPDLLVKLHEAVERGRWREVLQVAEQVLSVAPLHAEARKARDRAWKAVDPPTLTMPRRAEEPTSQPAPGSRFMLWIDGVDGCLVCLGARVSFGQAGPESAVEVPIFAEVSRIHAALTRDVEGYLFEAFRAAQVNGQPVEKALLQPGDRITLGPACQFQFSQPVPVSATARLDLVSGHRLPLAVSRVLLMAETLVLGPGPQAHVLLPDLKQNIVLFRQKDGLGVRHPGNLLIDGKPCRVRGTLTPMSRVTGDDFAFAVEPAR